MQLREKRSGFWRIRLISMEGLGACAALVLMVLLKQFVCLKKGLMGQGMDGKENDLEGRAQQNAWHLFGNFHHGFSGRHNIFHIKRLNYRLRI